MILLRSNLTKKFGPIDGFSVRFNQFESGLLFGATFLERQPHLIRSIFRGPNNSLRRLYWLRLITVLFGWSAPHRAASRLNRMIKSQWTRKTGYIIHAPIYRHLCGARTIVANHAARHGLRTEIRYGTRPPTIDVQRPKPGIERQCPHDAPPASRFVKARRDHLGR